MTDEIKIYQQYCGAKQLGAKQFIGHLSVDGRRIMIGAWAPTAQDYSDGQWWKQYDSDQFAFLGSADRVRTGVIFERHQDSMMAAAMLFPTEHEVVLSHDHVEIHRPGVPGFEGVGAHAAGRVWFQAGTIVLIHLAFGVHVNLGDAVSIWQLNRPE